MSALDFPQIRKELEIHVLACTGTRIQNLDIELSHEGIRLHGKTTTFYVKQLAQHSVRQKMPQVRLQNDITVM